MLFVVLCPGSQEGSTGRGSGFKGFKKNFLWLFDGQKPVLGREGL